MFIQIFYPKSKYLFKFIKKIMITNQNQLSLLALNERQSNQL